MKIKTTIKETTEKEIEMDVQFPMYLAHGKELVCITERENTKVFPFMTITISTLFEIPAISTCVCSDDEVAKYVTESDSISAESFNAILKDAMNKISERTETIAA